MILLYVTYLISSHTYPGVSFLGQKDLAILTDSHFLFQLLNYISAAELEENQLVYTKQVDSIPVNHQFLWVFIWLVFWASGLVLGCCGIACGFQDSFNHLLFILNAGKEMVNQTLV